MNCAPTSGAPSSPDSARKITSRSSGAFGALEHEHQHQAGDEVVLVVDRAAAVDVAAVARRRRRAGCVHFFGSTVTTSVWPMTRSGRFFPLPLMRATRFGRCGSLGEHLVRDALLVEHLLQVLHGPRFRFRAGCWCRAAAAPGSAAAFRPRSRTPLDGARAADGCRDSDTVSRTRSRAVRDMRRRIAEGPSRRPSARPSSPNPSNACAGPRTGVAIHIAGCARPPFWIAPRRVAGEATRSRRNSWIARGWPRFRVRTRVCKTGRAGPFKEGNAACPRRSRS